METWQKTEFKTPAEADTLVGSFIWKGYTIQWDRDQPAATTFLLPKAAYHRTRMAFSYPQRLYQRHRRRIMRRNA